MAKVISYFLNNTALELDGLILPLLFPAAPDAATLHRMEPRHPERLTNPQSSKRLGTSCGKRRLSLPLQLFCNFNLRLLNFLHCFRICLKKTHSSTHLQIPILDHNTEIRSCIYSHLDSTQCLPSNKSFLLGAKNFGTRLTLIT